MPHSMNPAIAAYAYGSGLCGQNDQVIVAGTPLDETEHQLFAHLTQSLVELVFHAFRARHQSDPVAFAQRLGKPAWQVQLLLSLSAQQISPAIFARADIVRTVEGFKLIELNLGTQIGGMYYASLPRLAGIDQPHDALQRWSRNLLAQLPDPQAMVFTDTAEGAGWMSPYCQQLSRELALRTGTDTPLVACEAFSYRNGRLYAAGREVKSVYSWLSDNDVYQGQATMQPLLHALQDGAAQLVMSPLAPLFANKGVFAELWQMHESRQLSQEQSLFLKTYVPFTQWLDEADSEWVRTQRAQLVIKPADGYGGLGVAVGAEYSHHAWCQLIEEQLKSIDGSRHVVQKLTLPVCQPVAVCRWDGSHGWDDSRVVWGAFVQGGEYLGAYARSKPGSDSLVINQGNGAAVGAATVE